VYIHGRGNGLCKFLGDILEVVWLKKKNERGNGGKQGIEVVAICDSER
jgi:hypothetical protein